MWYVPVLKGIGGSMIMLLMFALLILFVQFRTNDAGPLFAVVAIVLTIGALIGALFIGT